MAELITCATCGLELPAVVRVCSKCGQDPRAIAQPAMIVGGLSAGVGVQMLVCNEPGCTGEVVQAGDPCPYCERPIGGAVWRLGGLEQPLELRPGQELLLGRAEGAAASSLVHHPNVSKAHAVLRLEGAQAWITDLGSLNGTFIDGRRLLADHPEPVTSNVELRLASDVVLQLERES